MEFHSLWRASANEAVAYANDFPEALLVLPELIDGALGDGRASEIRIDIDLSPSAAGKLILTVKDNGVGIVNERRLQDWAAKTSGTKSEHIYGHGSKKCLTKWMPDYDTADWKIKWRKQDKRGVSGALHILTSPFLGLDTAHHQDDIDEKTCEISGTEWEIHFDGKILNKTESLSPSTLMTSLREIICTRYEKSLYHAFEIKISIRNAHGLIQESSKSWKTLKETLNNEIKKNTVEKQYDFTDNVDDTKFTCQMYKIITDGRGFKLEGFPLFGVKNMKASRVHIANKNRYIEALPYGNFIGKESHNSDNGIIGFINFIEGPLPTPCTTKVKFQEDCPIFLKCMAKIKTRLSTVKCQKSTCQAAVEKTGDYCSTHKIKPVLTLKKVKCQASTCQTVVGKTGDYCAIHQPVKPIETRTCQLSTCQTVVGKTGDYCAIHQPVKPIETRTCQLSTCQTAVGKTGDYCAIHQPVKPRTCQLSTCQTVVGKTGDFCWIHQPVKPIETRTCQMSTCQTVVGKTGDFCWIHQPVKPIETRTCQMSTCQTAVGKTGDYCAIHQPVKTVTWKCQASTCQTSVGKTGDYCSLHLEEKVEQLKAYVEKFNLDVILDILKKHLI